MEHESAGLHQIFRAQLSVLKETSSVEGNHTHDSSKEGIVLQVSTFIEIHEIYMYFSSQQNLEQYLPWF